MEAVETSTDLEDVALLGDEAVGWEEEDFLRDGAGVVAAPGQGGLVVGVGRPTRVGTQERVGYAPVVRGRGGEEEGISG